MRWEQFFTFKIQREAGFRFNLIDLCLILFLILASWLLYSIGQGGYLYLLPLYVGLSFFLFCNVFRIGNRIEPLWYIPFAICVVLLNKQPITLWWVILLEPIKIGLIIYAIRREDYHGVKIDRVEGK